MTNWFRSIISLVEDANDEANAPHDDIPDKLLHWDRNEDGPDFGVMSDKPENRNKTRPLAVLIHPGDMIETDEVGDGRFSPRKYSEENQRGTAEEIERLHAKGCDVVVLHRNSCSQFYDGPGLHELTDAIEIIWDHHTVLFGDDLRAAAEWIIKNCDVADRPMIYMLGAYSTVDDGCVTSVGKALMQVVGKNRIKVSRWSPGGNNPGERVWRPSRPKGVRHSTIRWHDDKDGIS